MVAVAVGEEDGVGSAAAVSLLHPVSDEARGVGDGGIDQGPGAVRVGDAEDVDKGDAETGEAGGDVVDGDDELVGDADLVHAMCDAGWDRGGMGNREDGSMGCKQLRFAR